ncbi:MAG TPA: histidine kinase [Terracidiphilus sp.]|nr:histidine kinase [Terracidiphilus sp.]
MTERNPCPPIATKRPVSRLAEGLFHAAWIVPSVAVLVVVLFLALGHARISETGARLANALVYSALIGIPSAILLDSFSHRYTERLGRWVVIPQILLLAITGTLGSLAAAVALQFAGLLHHSSWRSEFHDSYPFALVITLVVGLAATIYETLRYKLQAATIELRTRQVEQERANKLLAEAKLSSLESRIHPHFLFNTLNSIASLIPSDPRRAEDTVAKLASLLRFSLTANPSGLVPLTQELKVVRDYLEIESTRFGPRLRYQIDVPEDLLNARTLPLSLATLVENAVKHVASRRPEGAHIRVTGTRHDGRVLLEVIDNGPGFSLESISPDHGLGNLMARLELLFSDQASVRVGQRNGETVVSLEFPAGDAP